MGISNNVSMDRMARIQAVIEKAQSRTNSTVLDSKNIETIEKTRVSKTALQSVGTMFQKMYGENIADSGREKIPTLGTLFDAYA